MRVAEDLADYQPSAGAENTRELSERGALIGHFAKNGDEECAVEVAVVVWKVPRVSLRCRHVPDAPRRGTTHRVVEHLLLEVEHVEGSAGCDPLCDVQAVVAGARPDLEDPIPRLGVQRIT